jgi:hypothetical protein
MKKFTTKQVIDAARQLLTEKPDGLQYTDLIKAILEIAPGTPRNTITSCLQWWARETDEVSRPAKGLFVLKSLMLKAESAAASAVKAADPAQPKLLEADLYQPFAEWLVEQQEATDARALGGSSLQAKWGTPDVIGVTKPQPADPVKFGHEIVAVEIKSEALSAIVAFGQACAYSLFAHRVYIVMPATIPLPDRDRLQALCSLYGIGFVLWEKDQNGTQFSMQERARSRPPDMFYANEFARGIQKIDVKVFNALF